MRRIESEPVAMLAATAAKRTSSSTSLGWAVGSRPSRFVPALPPNCDHALLPKQPFGMGGADGQHRQAPYLISGGSVYIGCLIVEGFILAASGARWQVGGRLDAGVKCLRMETTCSTWGSSRKSQGSNGVGSPLRRYTNGAILSTGGAPVQASVPYAQRSESAPAQKRSVEVASSGRKATGQKPNGGRHAARW